MKLFNFLAILFFICIFYSCSERIEGYEKKQDECPCDSMGIFERSGKIIADCHLGKSLITIAHLPNNDTMEVTRRYTEDSVWHFQEFMVILKNELVAEDFAIYCEIKDSSDFYKLKFIRNEELFIEQGVITNKILGVEAIVGTDTIKSKELCVVIPKAKFRGIIPLDKILNITYNGKQQITRARIYLEAEEMIKYGSLLQQYNVIARYCGKKH